MGTEVLVAVDVAADRVGAGAAVWEVVATRFGAVDATVVPASTRRGTELATSSGVVSVGAAGTVVDGDGNGNGDVGGVVSERSTAVVGVSTTRRPAATT